MQLDKLWLECYKPAEEARRARSPASVFDRCSSDIKLLQLLIAFIKRSRL